MLNLVGVAALIASDYSALVKCQNLDNADLQKNETKRPAIYLI